MKTGISLFILSMLAFGDASAQILPSFGNSRTGTAGMQFLKIGPDARSAAMGGAVTAICNDVSSLYWNAAGIALIDETRVQFMVAHTAYFTGVGMDHFGTVFKAGKRSHIGIQVTSLNYGDIKETTEFQPFGTGRTFNLSNYNIGASYAKRLTDNFSFGLTGKFAHEGIAGVAINNVLFDLGLRYNVGVKNTRFAVTLSNYGVNVKPSGQVQILKFNGQNEIMDFQRVSVPGIFRIGAAFDPVSKGDHILTLSGQLNHYTDNNETFSFGAEYAWRKIIYLRSGYEFGVDEGGIPGMGFGLNLKRRFGMIRIDYGYSNKRLLGNVHRLSILVGLKSIKN